MIQRSHEQEFPISDAEKAIEHLKWCYKIGLEFNKNSLSRDGKKKTEALAKARNISLPDVRWYRQLARNYSEQDLEALFELCRLMNFVLSFTHFRVFLCVKDRAARAELEQRTIREGLGTVGTRELKDRLIKKPASQCGRKPRLLTRDQEEVEWLFNRVVDKLIQHLQQVLDHRQDLQPERRERLQQMLERLLQMRERLQE